MKWSARSVLQIALTAILLLWASDMILAEAHSMDGNIQAIVQLQVTVPPDAITAGTLGTEREGSGVLIDSNGLILTVGYLIVEADKIEVQTAKGIFPADFVGYDGDTGFGLVRARDISGLQPIQLGESSQVQVGDHLQVEAFGQDSQSVRVISRDEFVGYWEYLIDSAIYAAPAITDFGGAALVREGKLVGVGSILASFSLSGVGRVACNMFVPIDLLKPILQELVRSGQSGLPSHPWLGVNTAETEGRVVVTTVTPKSPAEQAGLKRGDVILSVGQQPVSGIDEFYRKLWAAGPAGVSVELQVLQGNTIRELTVKTADRTKLLRHPPSAPEALPSGSAAFLTLTRSHA